MKPLALVIDHDAGTRKLLDVLLTRFGYEVDRVALSADALTLLAQIDYDFILSDDVQVAKWISTNRSDALSRMMILSSTTESHLERLRAEWAEVRIIRKPFELADVIDASSAAAASRTPRIASAVEEFCRRSVTSGAKSGLILRRAGERMELVTAFGYEPGMIEAFFPLSVNEPYPICVSVRQGRPVWLASLAATSDYPLLAAVWQKNESRALAALPLLREGAVIGAAGWTFREPQRFTDADQRTWLAIADFGAGIAEGGNSAQPATQAGA